MIILVLIYGISFKFQLLGVTSWHLNRVDFDTKLFKLSNSNVLFEHGTINTFFQLRRIFLKI